MNARKKALLEAALLCSRRADVLGLNFGGLVARELACDLGELADSPLHYYPPGKPVIDLGQDSENSFP